MGMSCTALWQLFQCQDDVQALVQTALGPRASILGCLFIPQVVFWVFFSPLRWFQGGPSSPGAVCSAQPQSSFLAAAPAAVTVCVEKAKRDECSDCSHLFCDSPNAASSRDGLDNETGTESVISHRRERHRRRNREGHEDGESCFILPLSLILFLTSFRATAPPARTEETCVCIPACFQGLSLF